MAERLLPFVPPAVGLGLADDRQINIARKALIVDINTLKNIISRNPNDKEAKKLLEEQEMVLEELKLSRKGVSPRSTIQLPQSLSSQPSNQSISLPPMVDVDTKPPQKSTTKAKPPVQSASKPAPSPKAPQKGSRQSQRNTQSAKGQKRGQKQLSSVQQPEPVVEEPIQPLFSNEEKPSYIPPVSKHSVPLTTTELADPPELRFSPESFLFDAFEVGKTHSMSMDVTVTGTKQCAIVVDGVPPEFGHIISVQCSPAGRMAPGVTTKIKMTFVPVKPKPIRTILTIRASSGRFYEIPVLCNPAKPELVISSSLVEVGPCRPAESWASSWYVKNIGTARSSFDLVVEGDESVVVYGPDFRGVSAIYSNKRVGMNEFKDISRFSGNESCCLEPGGVLSLVFNFTRKDATEVPEYSRRVVVRPEPGTGEDMEVMVRAFSVVLPVVFDDGRVTRDVDLGVVLYEEEYKAAVTLCNSDCVLVGEVRSLPLCGYCDSLIHPGEVSIQPNSSLPFQIRVTPEKVALLKAIEERRVLEASIEENTRRKERNDARAQRRSERETRAEQAQSTTKGAGGGKKKVVVQEEEPISEDEEALPIEPVKGVGQIKMRLGRINADGVEEELSHLTETERQIDNLPGFFADIVAIVTLKARQQSHPLTLTIRMRITSPSVTTSYGVGKTLSPEPCLPGTVQNVFVPVTNCSCLPQYVRVSCSTSQFNNVTLMLPSETLEHTVPLSKPGATPPTLIRTFIGVSGEFGCSQHIPVRGKMANNSVVVLPSALAMQQGEIKHTRIKNRTASKVMFRIVDTSPMMDHVVIWPIAGELTPGGSCLLHAMWDGESESDKGNEENKVSGEDISGNVKVLSLPIAVVREDKQKVLDSFLQCLLVTPRPNLFVRDSKTIGGVCTKLVLDYGTIPVGSTVTRSVTFTSTCPTTLHVPEPPPLRGAFTLTKGIGGVTIGTDSKQSLTASIEFSPEEAGKYETLLMVTQDTQTSNNIIIKLVGIAAPLNCKIVVVGEQQVTPSGTGNETVETSTTRIDSVTRGEGLTAIADVEVTNTSKIPALLSTQVTRSNNIDQCSGGYFQAGSLPSGVDIFEYPSVKETPIPPESTKVFTLFARGSRESLFDTPTTFKIGDKSIVIHPVSVGNEVLSYCVLNSKSCVASVGIFTAEVEQGEEIRLSLSAKEEEQFSIKKIGDMNVTFNGTQLSDGSQLLVGPTCGAESVLVLLGKSVGRNCIQFVKGTPVVLTLNIDVI